MENDCPAVINAAAGDLDAAGAGRLADDAALINSKLQILQSALHGDLGRFMSTEALCDEVAKLRVEHARLREQKATGD